MGVETYPSSPSQRTSDSVAPVFRHGLPPWRTFRAAAVLETPGGIDSTSRVIQTRGWL